MLSSSRATTENSRVINLKRYAIFASGNGSNAVSLIEEGLRHKCPPQFVLSNVQEAPILDKAKEMGIKVFTIVSKVKGIDRDFEEQALKLCQDFQIDWLFLAGFLKILSLQFLRAFQFKEITKDKDSSKDGFYQVVNIHPSLLPLYPGLGAYKKAFDNKDPFFGHTVHLVTEGVDEGPILFQKKIQAQTFTSFEEFQQLGKKKENESYAYVLSTMLEHGLNWDGHKISLLNSNDHNF
jgi:phosphoribosylglycinamide formyltransferase-1